MRDTSQINTFLFPGFSISSLIIIPHFSSHTICSLSLYIVWSQSVFPDHRSSYGCSILHEMNHYCMCAFWGLEFVLYLTACAKRAEAINHSSWYDETLVNQGKTYQKCARRHNRKSDINCTCCNKTSILGQPLCQPVLWA